MLDFACAFVLLSLHMLRLEVPYHLHRKWREEKGGDMAILRTGGKYNIWR